MVTLGEQQYICASLLRRYLAQAIDYAIIYVPAWTIIGRLQNGIADMALFWCLALSLGLVMFTVFLVIPEALWGKTIGKLLLRIKTVTEDGKVPGLKAAILRNLLRIVDGLAGYLVGAIIFRQSEKHQRLGDSVAHTLVVVETKL